MVPWPPPKELEARKCLGEDMNFASEALFWGKKESQVALAPLGSWACPGEAGSSGRPLRQAEGG